MKNEINKLSTAGLKYSHTSLKRGYVSRKNPEGEFVPYNGRFGKGVKQLTPNWNSTKYCFVAYYLEEV